MYNELTDATIDMKKALITGGAGFIGSHMCEALIRRGFEVTCLDNFSTGSRKNIEHLPDLNVIEADVNEQATWEQLKAQPFDIVFHYAATVGVRRNEEQPVVVMADARGLLHVADFARAGYAKKIIYASSSEIYGEPKAVPTAETDGHAAWSPYTAVKLLGEHLFQSLWQAEGIPTVSLRFFNVYGPRQAGNSYGFVVSRFCEQAVNDQPPTVFGDGLQTRDFVYITDNIKATLAAMDDKKADGKIINIGTGRETSVLELANMIIEAAGKKGKIDPAFLPKRPLEINRRCADVSHMHEWLNTECSIALAQGISSVVEWHMHVEHASAAIPAVQPT